MAMSSDGDVTSEGLRARKRKQTLQRITDAGIRLFLEKGYDGTTLDEIAAAAGISRRTFFHYFEFKDDILLSLQSGMGDLIADAVRAAPSGKRPLEAVRDAVLQVCGAVPPLEMRALDQLMHSSRTVMARKQASYVEHEKTLFEALRERWPDPAREGALRLVAMVAVGAIRLSAEAFREDPEGRTMVELLREAFAGLEAEL